MAQKSLTSEQMQEAIEAFEKYDSKTKAAESLKIPLGTFNSRYKRALAEDAKAGDGKKVKQLEKENKELRKRYSELSKSKYKIPKSKKSKVNKKAFSRVVIPDTHGCKVDSEALSAFLYDLEQMSGNVKEIVMLGDHLDCGGFLAQHHTMGYVAETTYTFEDDTNATNQLLDRVQKICPKAEIHYLLGNHEQRLEKWCVTQALRNNQDAAYLKSLFGVGSVLHLEKRGISMYDQGKCYHGLSIPATIRLGKCFFTHGSRTGVSPARAMLKDFGDNVVFGHVHRSDSCIERSVSKGIIGAWSPGCLCELQALWMHTQITGWSHGYGLQLVNPDDTFLHINVPIIDGKSYLLPLTSKIAG